MHQKVLPLVSPYRVNVVKSRTQKEEVKKLIKDPDPISMFKLPDHLRKSSVVSEDHSKFKVKEEGDESRNIQSPFMRISPNEQMDPQSSKFSSLVSLSGSKQSLQLRPFEFQVQSGREKSKFQSPMFVKSSKSTLSVTNRGKFEFISPNASNSQRKLNLTDSQLNPLAFSKIIEIILKPTPMLQYLKLENTGLADSHVSMLCENLHSDMTLKFLGLARNGLTFRACRSIKEFLKENCHLKKLDLHWNSVKDLGCSEVFEGLCFNENLKELDLSWNGIGSCKVLRSIRKMANCFGNFQGLMHLDLSFNHLTAGECEILGKGLEKNNQILGIHIAGNEGKIDSLGYLEPNMVQVNIKESHLFSRIFQTKKMKKRLKYQCWLCEKWVECVLSFSFDKFPEQFLQAKEVFVHFETDEYQADLLHKSDSNFLIIRMLPAGPQQIFFSTPDSVFTISSLTKSILLNTLTRTVRYSKTSHLKIEIKTVNLINIEGTACSYKRPLRTVPRRPRFTHSPLSIKLVKPFWSIELSIFKDLKLLTRSLISDCLLFDWRQSRLAKLIKKEDEQQQFHQLLLKHYESIIETFKHLAIQSGNEIPSIGSNVFTEFLNQKDLFDEFYDTSDLGVNWSAVKTAKVRQLYNQGNALVRYEFTEILVRIAIDKYVRHKRVKSISQGFQWFLKEGLEELLVENNSQVWRNERMLNVKVDVTLKAFRPVLEAVFKDYSGRKTLPGQKAFMSLEEFKKVFVDCKVLDLTVPSRDLEGCFYLAMTVQVDEVFESRHLEMGFFEFLEGVCRVCEISNAFGVGKSFRFRLLGCCRLLMGLCPKSVLENFTVPSKEVLRCLINEFH